MTLYPHEMMCMYVCMYVRMYVHMYVCMYIYMYVCMYVCMTCMYVCMCMYVCLGQEKVVFEYSGKMHGKTTIGTSRDQVNSYSHWPPTY